MKKYTVLITLIILYPLVVWACIEWQIEKPVVVFMGDSITRGVGSSDGLGYRKYIINKFGNKMHYILEAHNGWTSTQLLKIAPLLMLEIPQRKIVILMTGANDEYWGISSDNTEKNAKEIIRIIKADTRSQIFVSDAWKLPSELLSDNVHPNDAGYKIIGYRWIDILSKERTSNDQIHF